MKVEYINPFITSVVSVYDTMLGCSLTRGKPYLREKNAPPHEVSGIIGLSGKAKGTVVLCLSEKVAIKSTEAFLGEPCSEMSSEVADAIGELTNIIAGGAKAQLEELHLSVSLPNVIIGRGYTVDFPKSVAPVCIPFESPWGPVIVELGLVDVPQDAQATV